MRAPEHIPVMRDEIADWLALAKGDVVVDGTMGGGGHTQALAAAVGAEGLVLAIDRDPAALAAAEQNLRGLPVKVAHANYSDLPELLEQEHMPAVDGILLDLGLSSDQLADGRRGFSFDADGPLDLRFDPNAGKPAWQLIERLNPEQLADLIYEYGEERYSRRIARRIYERRQQQPIRTARELADLVRGCIPRKQHPRGIDAATRTFQALRIAVNEELKWLEVALRRFPDCLRPGGRLAVISFHSLEDRCVKQAFRDNPLYEPLTKRPIRPTAEEIRQNPRARSAKLRVAARTDAAVGT